MDTLIKADIFFVVSAVSIVLLTVLVVVALFYVIHILRNIGRISDDVKEESEEIIDDIHTLRENMKEGGGKIKNVISRYISPRGEKDKHHHEHTKKRT